MTVPIAMLLLLSVGIGNAFAEPILPRAAVKYRADLTRIAHADWGMGAPIAAFAAQIHQESEWNPLAVSRVGATGMTQFMPDTAKWWCAKTGTSASDCQPSNPVWAMRALVGYDRWLFQRVSGTSDFDRLWAALRAYNGGLGHWQQEAKVAGSIRREDVDFVCGSAKRSRQFCPENLGYPRRILNLLQPLYLGWGLGVAP
ncbi:transglycosylase SLT domain-containing protein [Methylobacter sp.]|uniref:transglycosylase SLT domain-containing protein n=1 Tax=Methylobacter sp. TaxID=2051955 RepID=UPI00248A3B27|nr:transglycosylase SLT domain-containing protein [Methylobacter sp.]MDI1279279.1 transglycosylase SLT domain-containing protein [Methylobacter sp.]